jgi:AcrR family transcriptional regulator
MRMSTSLGDTKGRILDAAERLFGERGFAGTSLRAVTEAAGANVAAVNYHFGSKEGLLRAVVRRAMASVNDDRRCMLEELRATSGDPDVEDLVRAFVVTGASLIQRHREHGRQIAQLVGRVLCEPDPQIRQLFAAEVAPEEGPYLDALDKALPHLTTEELAFRYRAMIGLLALHQTGTFADLQPPDAPQTNAAHDTERLVTLLTAVFRAPSPND